MSVLGVVCIWLTYCLHVGAFQEDVTYDDYNVLEEDYRNGKIWPGDLKPAVTEALNRILEPVRVHFESGEPKKLLDKIKKFKVTR
jgi:tyrosyl-tRNA synthetase